MWARALLAGLLSLVVLLVTGWGVLALWFQLSRRWALAFGAVWCLLGLGVLAVTLLAPARRYWRQALLACAIGVVAMGAWYQGLTPSHDRLWADDVAQMLESHVDGDIVTLDNVRNFDWRTETDYTPRWETRQYDLRKLESADLILSYWMGPHIAHTLIAFGFRDGKKLVFSLEIRKERQESFSAIGGFFRNFEQVIVAADERDIVRTRSNVRGEQVYLYRLRAKPEHLRAVLLDYLERAEKLRHHPEWYNTLTSNCTTILFELARRISPGLPLDWRLLASGHFAEYAYDQDALTPDHPFAELQERGYINERALATDRDGADFSRAIRVGVPGIAQP